MRPDDSLKLTLKKTEVIPEDIPIDKALAIRRQLIMQAFQPCLMIGARPERNT